MRGTGVGFPRGGKKTHSGTLTHIKTHAHITTSGDAYPAFIVKNKPGVKDELLERDCRTQIGRYGKSGTQGVSSENRVFSLSTPCLSLCLSVGRPCVPLRSLSEQTEMRVEEWSTHRVRERGG